MRTRGWKWLRSFGVLAAVSCGIVASTACGVFAEQPVVSTPTAVLDPNRLQNAGFESGEAPWYALEQGEWRRFAIADGFARTGEHSLKLELRGEEAAERTRIAGAIQRIEGGAPFPEFLSGYYYVDRWEPIEPFQYLQFVVSIHGGNHPDGGDIHQVRFIVAGAQRPPFTLSNAVFLFLRRGQPDIGEWTYFSYPILDAVRTRLGWDPVDWEFIEVFFEVRYDQKTIGTVAAADVYYDDLYIGQQALNPNRPDE
jgi:hypothetical protein